jgi:hypothetical protein
VQPPSFAEKDLLDATTNDHERLRMQTAKAISAREVSQGEPHTRSPHAQRCDDVTPQAVARFITPDFAA